MRLARQWLVSQQRGLLFALQILRTLESNQVGGVRMLQMSTDQRVAVV